MTIERRVNWILALSFVAVVLAIGGIVLVGLQGQKVIDVVQAKPCASSRLWLDYTDSEGRPQHVEVTSLPGEGPRALVLRLREAVAENEREFPRR